MDWTLAINRNRDALRRIVAVLFALAGMRVGGSLATVSRPVFNAVMLVLKPAESAVRRLITLAAHGLVLKPQAQRAAPVGLVRRQDSPRMMAFPLLDPLKSFAHEDYWDEARRFHENALRPLDLADTWRPIDATPVDASLIGLRLNALKRALDDLPAQARRLVRWQQKRDAALKSSKPTRLSPIRPGPPPGKRQRPIHEIDHVLRECHGLALDRLNVPDST